MLLNFQDIDEHFNQIGFMDRHEIKYTIRYYSEELKEYFYISKISGASPSTLIIHPKYEHLKIKLLSILGVVNESEYRHGTSMRKFPEKIKNPIKSLLNMLETVRVMTLDMQLILIKLRKS